MTIPHIQTIREHRAALLAGEGSQGLVLRIESIQTALSMCRTTPSDALPGDDVMQELVARPGLEGLAQVDAPATAPWEERIRARELALRAALANLRPLADAAHIASHAIHDLRKEQMEWLTATEHSDLNARVLALNEAYASSRTAQVPAGRQLQSVGPLLTLIQIYSDQISNALANTTPNREALCTAFTNATREGMTIAAEALHLTDLLPPPNDAPAEQQARDMLAAIAELNTRAQQTADDLTEEIRVLGVEMASVEREIEALLG